MKKIYFVSTGRCGTKRLAEILKQYLPEEGYAVQHQMHISRAANIAGNLMFYLGSWEWLKEKIHQAILKKYAANKSFVCTDPLMAMSLPQKIIHDPQVHIIHIVRDEESFSASFFRFSRKRALSFVAHNFIPFWQLGVWPLENILNPKIREKYSKVWRIKNDWFEQSFSVNPHYEKISMKELFTEGKLNAILQNHLDSSIRIKENDLQIKSNQTQ